MILIITSCSKSKKETSAIASEFYTGQFFRSIKKFAINNSFDFKILSAKYGLVSMNDLIEPYDIKLRIKSNIKSIQSKISESFSEIIQKYDKIIFIMGKVYLSVFEKFLSNKNISYFVDHRGIGGFNQIGFILEHLSVNQINNLITLNKKELTIEDLRQLEGC